MSLCNITYLTSLKPLHGFASNFVSMFNWWTPTKIVKIRVLPNFNCIIGNFVYFWQIFQLHFCLKPMTRCNSYILLNYLKTNCMLQIGL